LSSDKRFPKSIIIFGRQRNPLYVDSGRVVRK